MRRKRWPPYRRNTSLVHGSSASNGPWIDLKQPRLSPGRSKSSASNLTYTRLSSSSKNPRTSQALKVAYCPGSGRGSRRWRRKHGRYAAWRARSIARVRRDRFALSYAERGDNSLCPHRLPVLLVPTTPVPRPRLLDVLQQAAAERGQSVETVRAHGDWTIRFILFHGKGETRQGGGFGVRSFSCAPNEELIPNIPRNDELTSSIPRPG